MPPFVRRRGLLAVTLLAMGLAAAPATSSSAAVPGKAEAAKSATKKSKAAKRRCFRTTIKGKRRIVCTRVRTFRSKRRATTSPRLKVTSPTRLTGKTPATAVDTNGTTSTTTSTTTVTTTTTVTNPPTPTEPVTPAPPEAEPTPPAEPAGPTVLNETFDDPDFSLWQSVQRAYDDRITTVDAPGGRTGKVGRFEVRGTDRWYGTARAELAFFKEFAGEGMVRTYKWRTMFAADYPSSPLWQDVAQWKNEGEGTPPFQIKVEGEEISFQAGWQHTWKKFWKTPLVRNQWLEFEVKMKFSSDPSQGWAEIRFNGQEVMPRTAVQNLYPDLKNYFKVGLYRSEQIQPTGVVYHDDVQILEG